MKHEFDVVIIGAGIIGVAVARSLAEKKKAASIAILEKEDAPARHTSGRNSGVLHSGFNLKPGSLKAKFCVEGNARLVDFCQKKRLPFQSIGTLVVALQPSEIPTLEVLQKRGEANGVQGLEIVDHAGLKRLEPHAVGIAALHSPTGAIASGQDVTQALADEAQSLGCQFLFHQNVIAIESLGTGYRIRTGKDEFICQRLVNCAGLYADRIAHLMGVGLGYTIIPFRGQYYKIKPEKKNMVHSMIYPVPDLNFPFLGVHWTKTITGDLKVGPNAMMAFGRESYSPWSLNLGETFKMLTTVNFWCLLKSSEFRKLLKDQFWISISRTRFVEEARKLVPNVRPEDFILGKSGNRAQLVDRAGHLVEDVMVEKKGQSLHVLNAVSPGFTCSLPFADYLVELLTA